MTNEVQYVFACIGPSRYTVSKFANGDEPLDTYTIDASRASLECNCMAWYSGKTRPCKHGKMVQEYIKAGKPALGDYRCIGIGKDWIFTNLKGKQ